MVASIFNQWEFVSGGQFCRLECVRFVDKSFRWRQFRILIGEKQSQVVAVFDEKKVFVQRHPQNVALTPLASLCVQMQDRIIDQMRFSKGHWNASIELKEDEGIKNVVTLIIVNCGLVEI